MGSPPLTRGILSDALRGCQTVQDHPRLRGAYKLRREGRRIISGSPPLTRDIPIRSLQGIQAAEDHPRLRGAYQINGQLKRADKGSPPLTRGIREQVVDEPRATRITPAYAGHTSKSYPTCILNRDHPRLRGAYIPRWITSLQALGSPPLTRGIHHLASGELAPFGITPAYAGHTESAKNISRPVRDHPRLRGAYHKSL